MHEQKLKYLLRSTCQVSVERIVLSGAASHWWCTILGRARLEGPLSQLFPWKTKLNLICLKLTGDLPHDRSCLPRRWQVPTTIPQGAVQVWVNVPNHIWSHQPLMMHNPGQDKAGRTLVSALPLKNWTQDDLPETHRGPFPWWGLPPLKMAAIYHHPSRSSTGVSKCAKSHQELLAEKWRLADLLKNQRGPAPW